MTEAMARANELIRRTKETLSPGRMVAETEVSWLLGEARFLAETVLSLPQTGVETGLERAAAWHDRRSRETPDVFESELHEVSARSLRMLKDVDLGEIGPEHICKHKIHWPHPCDDCDRAALTPKVIDLDIEGETIAIPADIAAQVLDMGRVDWGATAELDQAGHLAHLAESLRLTREHFNFEDTPVAMHGLYLNGLETVLCHTGTSPNSGSNAQALAGAWNWLHDQAVASLHGNGK